jgi:hypothetical protein
MVPKKKSILDVERTEQQPAQEKVAFEVEPNLALTAEQVYRQRIAEENPEEQITSPGFVP